MKRCANPPDYDKVRQEIPSGYFLGIPQQKDIALVCQVLAIVLEQQKSAQPDREFYVLDIGSGKGYIDRILSGVYRVPVFCVDAMKERLNSSLRIQRLLNDDNPQTCSSLHPASSFASNHASSSPMINYHYKIRNTQDFSLVWRRFERFVAGFGRGKSIAAKPAQILILGLRLCGDLYYAFVDWLVGSFQDNRSVSKISVLIVPCCLKRCFLWSDPETDFTNAIINDMLLYAWNKHRFQTATLHSLDDTGDRFPFAIDLCL